LGLATHTKEETVSILNNDDDAPYMDIDNIRIVQETLFWKVSADFTCTQSDSRFLKLSGVVEMRLDSLPASSPLASQDFLRRQIAEQILRSAEGILSDE